MSARLAAIGLVLVACWQTSPALAPVAGNKCGNLGVVCLAPDGTPNGMCCDEGETCGGGKFSVGCPADMCCDIRGLPALVGPHLQRKAGGP